MNGDGHIPIEPRGERPDIDVTIMTAWSAVDYYIIIFQYLTEIKAFERGNFRPTLSSLDADLL
ncbi:hypothetical protein [Sphingomonas sp. YL-JM2C]